MTDKRVTLPTRHSYHTASNKTRKVKTPGGKLVLLRLKKRGAIPKCRSCKTTLNGIKSARPFERHRMPKSDNTVSRAYGGNLCTRCLSQNIMRAFYKSEHAVIKRSMNLAATLNVDQAKKVEA
ncbi:MAG: 60S ribosomal protein L34 [Marteilia pararefringens]